MQQYRKNGGGRDSQEGTGGETARRAKPGVTGEHVELRAADRASNKKKKPGKKDEGYRWGRVHPQRNPVTGRRGPVLGQSEIPWP